MIGDFCASDAHRTQLRHLRLRGGETNLVQFHFLVRRVGWTNRRDLRPTLTRSGVCQTRHRCAFAKALRAGRRFNRLHGAAAERPVLKIWERKPVGLGQNPGPVEPADRTPQNQSRQWHYVARYTERILSGQCAPLRPCSPNSRYLPISTV
jgi:hypothetical protein